MKRLIATTALAATLATGAFAATEGEISMLQKYVPTVDLQTVSDEQIDEMLLIANTESSDTEKAEKIQAVLTARNAINAEPLTPVEKNKIVNVVPDANFALLTDAEIVDLRLAIAGGNEDQIESVFMNLSSQDKALDPVMFSEAEQQQILNVVPNADFSKISAEESNEIRAALTGGDDNQIRTVIGAALDS
ncbi:hypothetical protein ACN2XU_23015 [Primorskyibacter sp. 2E107]|uniref:hypothetical protein n=1 Tax=Primorskyibacter sp. 2E107 TaxID=3403458 RepID=UPI003AF617A2